MALTRHTARAAAFFDVDGTLVDATTMFDFLAHHLSARGRPEEYPVFRNRLADMTRAGAGRTQRCRAYYGMYEGLPVSSVAEEGAQWFADRAGRPGFFIESALAEFRSHATAGHVTVLLSGSFAACLNPIAEHLGSDVLLCSRPEVRAGRFTGTIDTPMIGTAKADAVSNLADEHHLDLGRSFAYGDHISDVPYMEMVGHPVVVGGDAEMVAHAAQYGWARLPGGPERMRSAEGTRK
ncbi:HAD-IB family hydrolase [Streptomyces mirabilis]|uniref:HAD-IB family hydrolase n=1 Tax=Streptomyces mirabilis TaxID=68239 RepID=UPI002256467B|nr:HAD-IB family hydrolase [Streptomyces mirabilis]MCX4617729.1 HAD-IB family hydrolase [Streptomyces mirabilis]